MLPRSPAAACSAGGSRDVLLCLASIGVFLCRCPSPAKTYVKKQAIALSLSSRRYYTWQFILTPGKDGGRFLQL